MTKYNVNISSISPMLHHGVHSVGMDETTVKKKKGGNALLGDPEEWRKTIYYDEKIGVYLPAVCIEGSIIEAAKQFKSGRGTLTKYVRGGLFTTDDFLSFLVNKKTIFNLDDVEIDKRSVKNPSTKGRNMRYRAIFRQWESCFDIEITADDYIDGPMLLEMLKYAGKFIGVGDFRPRFGRFEVTAFKEIK